MIIPDVNLLLYAYDTDSPVHKKAVDWWEGCLNGDETIGLLPVVVFGFLRIGTSRRVFHNPMPVAEASGHVRLWLQRPSVELLTPGPAYIERVLKLLESLGTAGNLVTDTQIAVTALDHDAILHTTDSDFLRFGALRWWNPLTGAGSSGRRQAKDTKNT